MKAFIQLKYIENFQHLLSWGDSRAIDKAIEAREAKDFKREKLLLNDQATVDLNGADLDEIKEVVAFLEKNNSPLKGSVKGFVNKAKEYLDVISGSDIPIKSLDTFKTAFEQKIKENELRWLFLKEDDGSFLPFSVVESNKNYHKDDEGSYSYISIKLKRKISPFKPKVKDRWGDYRDKGSYQEKTIYIYASSLRDKTTGDFLSLSEIVKLKGCVFYHDSLKKEYDSCLENFFAIVKNGLNKVYITNSRCEKLNSESSWYWRKSLDYLKTGGINHRLVIDINDDLDSVVIPKESKKLSKIPMMPYIGIFNLYNHAYYYANANSLIEYKYNVDSFSNLVIPQDHKNVINIFINDDEALDDNLVEGKSGGIIVLCHGAPGMGKTLTAEIVSESKGKPLYRVHASQLGTNPEKIEEKMVSILRRSERIGAILLIDEADTYMRKRGVNIDQDAIVGVFLRLLEYYRGILFLTTNLIDEIDDAILSRINIHIKYETPQRTSLSDIFKIHLSAYNIDYNAIDVVKIVEAYDGMLSGRDVKNMCKNCAKIIAADKTVKFDIDLIKRIEKIMYLPNLKK